MSVPSTTLLDVLGATAPNRELTARKTSHIMERDGSEITGFVVTDKHGAVGIIDKSAVRWLCQELMYQLMHGPQHQSTSNTAATVSRDASTVRGPVGGTIGDHCEI